MLGISRTDAARDYCEVSLSSDTYRVTLAGLTRIQADVLVRVLTALDQQTVELRVETFAPLTVGTPKQRR